MIGSRAPALAVPVATGAPAPRRWSASLQLSLAYVGLVLLWAGAAGEWITAAYLLSFWHYYLYWLAYYYGAAALDDFKRDAILLKSVSLAVLGCAYLVAPLDGLSLAVVTLGFLLNIAGARALGPDRTYYGHELADLPERRITDFPFSWISHPMLAGNVAAFGGTLLNPVFCQAWWPLACAHVVLNLGLLLMELALVPQRRGARAQRGSSGPVARARLPGARILAVALGAALATELGLWAVGRGAQWLAAIVVSAAVTFAAALYGCYSVARPLADGPQNPREREADE